MVRSREAPTSSLTSHIIIILLLILIILFLAYVFLNKVETFANATPTLGLKYYYLPNCRYCKDFNPEWDKFVAMTKGKITAEKIDGSTGNGTVPSYVKGYPHIEFIVKDKPMEYKGERTAVALIKQMDAYSV